jgi:predicted methyltransferase
MNTNPSFATRATHAVLLAAAALLAGLSAHSTNAAEPAAGDAALKALVAGAQRTDANRARDVYRHPYETLSFFGLRADQRVVEIWPGPKGWWTEILAPWLKERGQYIAALPEVSRNPAYYQSGNDAFRAKAAEQPQQ